MNQYSAPYQLWLKSKNYSATTIRNYLVDLNKYLQFSGNQIFEIETISHYLDLIKTDPNKNRYTSSLTKFLQFAQDQKIINANPITKIKKQNCTGAINRAPTLEIILAQYQTYLTKKKFSPATIKNYLNDIRQFISWHQNTSEFK